MKLSITWHKRSSELGLRLGLKAGFKKWRPDPKLLNHRLWSLLKRKINIFCLENRLGTSCWESRKTIFETAATGWSVSIRGRRFFLNFLLNFKRIVILRTWRRLWISLIFVLLSRRSWRRLWISWILYLLYYCPGGAG